MVRQLVSFDWALKKLLRSKANFDILEGFLSELLHEDIKIQDILESESNRVRDADKSNKVDLLVKNQKEELIIIEVQYDYQASYFHRILYGTSKLLTEYVYMGMNYGEIKKIISVNIIYFDLGQGSDYIYKGTTNFIGLHNKDELKLSDNQKELYKADAVNKIFPEYYILKVNQFNDVAKDKLDEWIYFLKNDSIMKGSSAKGLKEASDKLKMMKLSPEEQKEFDRYFVRLMDEASVHESHYVRGQMEGEKKGDKKARVEMAREMKKQGIEAGTIVAVSGLTLEEIGDI